MIHRLSRTVRALLVIVGGFAFAGTAAALPQDATLSQDGAYFRVTWTPQPDDAFAWAAFSETPEVDTSSCSSQYLAANASQPAGTLLAYCPLGFTDNVYVRLYFLGQGWVDLTRPAADFDLRPVGPQTDGTIRNRQRLMCQFVASEWQRITPNTRIRVRIGDGTRLLAESNFESPNSPNLIRVWDITGSQVGKRIRCVIEAQNGYHSYGAGVSVRSYLVTHALPIEMSPQLILSEAAFPRTLPGRARRMSLSGDERRAGVIKQARYQAVVPTRALVADLSIFRTHARADINLGSLRAFCRFAKQLERDFATATTSYRMVSCNRIAVAQARRVYATTLVMRTRGSTRVAALRIVAGTSANGLFAIAFSRAGTAGRLAFLRGDASKTAAQVASKIALGVTRE